MHRNRCSQLPCCCFATCDLVATLGGPGPFTVFAPTDQAFTDAGINLNDFDTPEENQTLSEILLHHVVAGSVPSAMLRTE